MRFALAFALLLLPFDVVPVNFSTLSGFDWEQGMELPQKVRDLAGKKIGVTGFIRTEDGRQEDIDVFWLVDQNCDCQGAPKMNEIILCTMPEGQTISNDDTPIRVTGVFEAEEEVIDDYVVSLYRLSVDTVK